MTSPDRFDQMFSAALEQEANPAAPSGLEQRLLARLAVAADSKPMRTQPALAAGPLFASAQLLRPRRSALSTWTALGLHAAAILLVAFFVAQHAGISAPLQPKLVTLVAPPPPPPPVAPRLKAMGGGGGQHDLAPVTAGHLPRPAQEQTLPPKAPPTIAPKLTVEPTVVVQKDLKLADNLMPNLGAPNSTLKGLSLGNGNGTGLGSGNGSGIGPGIGGNIGGGVMHVGGSVHAPILVHQVDPEFSEEARKAKFSGNVEVYLIVDEQGNPTHVRVVRDVGMGLGEKAVEAVRQYRFKPALQNGKAVKVDMYIDVNFQIF